MELKAPVAYRFELLGTFRLHIGEVVLERFQTQKTAALLAFLAYYSGLRHSREMLVDLLWPDAELDVGRKRLSQALSWLRRQMELSTHPEAPALETDRLYVRLRLNAASVDALMLDAALNTATLTAEEALRHVVDLYQGPLLPGFYEDWVLQERDRLETSYLKAMHHLVVAFEVEGEVDKAITYSRRAVALSHLDEEAYGDLIRLLILHGNTAEAVRQYQTLERRLAREFGVRPSEAIRALIATHRGATVLRTSEAATLIPAPRTRFFGRAAEIAEIRTQVASGQERLVTLTGMGGAGKTRLAGEVAHRLAAEEGFCVAFTEIAELSRGRQIAPAIARSLRLSSSGDAVPLDQIVERFTREATLLVLDNFEHLAEDSEATALILHLLERVPTLTILVTSRQRIGVEGECEVLLSPLPSPGLAMAATTTQAATTATIATLLACPSVQLFVDRARAVRPDFTITAGNARAVAELCDRLEGLPLAIELCAAWAQTLTPEQMCAKLERRFELLVSRRRDIAPRHRTLRSAIEYGFLQLPEQLKQIFLRLVVFRGGWRLAAVEALLGSDHAAADRLSVLHALTELRERSLIFTVENRRAGDNGDGSGYGGGDEIRYRMLETLRDFAVEAFPFADEQEWHERHATYFCALAERAESAMRGPEQGTWLVAVEAEHDNLRAALDWALQNEQTEIALRLAGALGRFWHTRGYLREGLEWLQRGLSQYDTLLAACDERGQPLSPGVLAKAWSAFGHLNWSRGDYTKAGEAHEKALALRRVLGDAATIAESLYHLGITRYRQNHLAEAQFSLRESMVIAESENDLAGISRVLLLYGNLSGSAGELEAARDYYERSLAIERRLGNHQRSADALTNLGWVAMEEGDYAFATDIYWEALSIRRTLGDSFGAAIAYHCLGEAFRKYGKRDLAIEALTVGLQMAQHSDYNYSLGYSLRQFGLMALVEGLFEAGVVLIAFAIHLYQSLHSSFHDDAIAEYEAALEAARAIMPPSRYRAAWMRGNSLSTAEAVRLALGLFPAVSETDQQGEPPPNEHLTA